MSQDSTIRRLIRPELLAILIAAVVAIGALDGKASRELERTAGMATPAPAQAATTQIALR